MKSSGYSGREKSIDGQVARTTAQGLVVAATLLLLLLPLAVRAEPVAQQNLLTNGGFEGLYAKQCCHTATAYAPNTPIDEVQVAPGWKGWWREPVSIEQDPYSPYVSYCDYRVVPETCQPYHRPEYREAAPFTERIHSGANAQKYFTFYSVHEGGLYQQVSGVAVGQKYRFTAYMHAWSTNDDALRSSNQPSMGMQVGIDPNGGIDPFSPSIVWGQQVNAFDEWYLFGVDATAKNTTITVFTRSHPQLAWKHNDVYVDDASLIAIAANAPPLATVAETLRPANAPTVAITQSIITQVGATATPGPSLTPSNTPKPPTPTWPPTSTPLPSGEVWYTVRAGDTLAVIAYYHLTTADDIKRLNSLTSNAIFPGNKLLIKYETPQPTPTDTPPVSPTPSNTPELVQLPTGTQPSIANLPNYGQLCVVAYNDANGNATNDAEPMLADVRVTLSLGESPIDGFVTSSNEAVHCFPFMPPNTYTITVAAPAGFTPSTAHEALVELKAGSLITLAFGISPVASSPAAAQANQPMPILLMFIGITIVLMGVTGAAAFWIARKK